MNAGRRLLLPAVVVAVVAAALIATPGLWDRVKAPFVRSPDLLVVTNRPKGIMGTMCTLTGVVEAGRQQLAVDAVRKAEQVLRTIEMRMSTYVRMSEVSLLNAAEAGRPVSLSPDTLEVLRLAGQLHGQTDGAFDVTCLPVFRLWARAGKQNRLPADEELAAARALCGWGKFELLEAGARKTIDGAGVGLGGIAKGYSIDRALEAIRSSGCPGGLVDVGGDIRCFGTSPRRGRWRVAVQNPFDTSEGARFGTLALTDLAVCTSGNYRRFAEIGGKRYSHIIDPRTARPVDLAPSVTVVAPTAAVADGWATALSVLGPAGLKRIPPAAGIEALLVVGGPDDYQLHQTGGFAKLLIAPVPVSGPTHDAP